MKHHPFYRIAVGSFLLLMWVAGSSFTILTDENLLEGGNGSISLSWEVLKQPYYLITGHYSGIELIAILGSFMIFSMYVLLSVLEVMRPDKTLRTIVWILITIDGIANFMFFHAYPNLQFVYQCMLTGLVFVSLVYSGPKGLELVASGLSEVSAKRRGVEDYE